MTHRARHRTNLRVPLAVALCVAAADCARGEPAGAAPPLPATPAAQRSAPDRGGAPRSCEVVLRDLRFALSSVESACERDADCLCFDQGYGPHGCGLVARHDAVKKLQSLVAEAQRGRCAPPAACPRVAACKPYCRRRGPGPGYCLQRDRCVELSDAFEATLAKASGKCKTVADCGFYRAGVGRNCGGETDRATAKALAKIADEFFANKCRYQVNCAPRMVRPLACIGGMCGSALPRGARR